MAGDETVDLMREFKTLTQKARAGTPLSPTERERRQELKVYLKNILLSQSGSAATAPPPPPAAAAPPPPAAAAPPPPAAAAPPPAAATTAEPQPFSPEWAPTYNKASRQDLEEMWAKADAAIEAQKKNAPPQTPKEATQQFVEQQKTSFYKAPIANYHLSAYYGDYLSRGYEFVDAQAVAMPTIDPREAELQKMGINDEGESETFTIKIPSSLAFIDDYPIIYELGLLPTPEQESEPDIADTSMWIPGKRRVIIHMLNGQTQRGTIRYLKKGDSQFSFEPQGGGSRKEISFSKIKAVFVHLPTDAKLHKNKGKLLTITFNDRRSIQGYSEDYNAGCQQFTLIPQENQKQFERVIVNENSLIAVQ